MINSKIKFFYICFVCVYMCIYKIYKMLNDDEGYREYKVEEWDRDVIF